MAFNIVCVCASNMKLKKKRKKKKKKEYGREAHKVLAGKQGQMLITAFCSHIFRYRQKEEIKNK